MRFDDDNYVDEYACELDPILYEGWLDTARGCIYSTTDSYVLENIDKGCAGDDSDGFRWFKDETEMLEWALDPIITDPARLMRELKYYEERNELPYETQLDLEDKGSRLIPF